MVAMVGRDVGADNHVTSSRDIVTYRRSAQAEEAASPK
eukprot:CAMPEP_0181170518 /NCGR_PEP_ID=MMETSP1096-20121128/1407_1 /TAXON_ID=156174 ORGANISM="Chrysochromulina ericina, Strain CCMP281" /NCGR_SAMPLE_ID=MMETSP1096 /ASSEMBLY_ACC=CAM_ASM_000453 /LENGTH=37 /DNA_ID= /DNA_START= /DNA_END= /DNA_ORIENTATION=